jgi:(R)-2-hydroxyacyl-CoA dehydratese activating ATPase
MRTAGIDIGSRTIKLVVLEGAAITHATVVPSGSNPLECAQTLLAGLENVPLIATGYGRDLIDIQESVPTISEIKAHALGARHFFQDAAAVIDIGGQDLKIICLDKSGKAARFEMNDRCAAGTGKFLEIMAEHLGFPLKEFGRTALAGKDSITINAQCTVFAESEVVGLVNRNHPRQDIARALHRTVANRVTAMFKRVAPRAGQVAITGGGALNPALVKMIGDALGTVLLVPPSPQTIGALGCALHAITPVKYDCPEIPFPAKDAAPADYSQTHP